MIRLVVNAEELGASPQANRGIVRAHRHGIVTSASLLGNTDDLSAVRDVLTEAPDLGIGLTLTLVGGRPVSPAGEIPSLLLPDGALRGRAREFALAWGRGAISPDDARREMEAQIRRALDAGLALDHLDTRAHLGFIPGVGTLVEQLARQHGIPGLRSLVEPPNLGWLTDPRRGVESGVVAGLAWLTRRRLGALRHGPRTWGQFEAGRLDEVRILEVLGRLEPGAHELSCHPLDDGGSAPPAAEAAAEPATAAARELGALTSAKVKRAIARRNIELCTWRSLF